MSRTPRSLLMRTSGSCLRRRSSLAGFGFLCLLTGAWVGSTQTLKPILELYDLSPDAGQEAKLPRALEEISGLATTPDGRLFAHDDERAIVYQIDPENGEILKAFSVGTMGIRGDFEGIAVAGERFFLATSAGQIVEFREGAADSSVGYRIHSLGLGNLCELEGLAFDEAAGALLLPCKNPRARNLRGHLVVFSVPLNIDETRSDAPSLPPAAGVGRQGPGQ